MAERASYTVDQVIDELDENSDDDFDGYLDTEFDDGMEDRSESDVEEGDDPTLGANVEIGPSNTDVPEYGLSPGCSATVEANSPFSFFSLLITGTIFLPARTNFLSRFISHE